MTEPHHFHPAEIRPEKGELPAFQTAGAFLVNQGRLLLEKRPDDAAVYAGLWDTPGGHVEEGETPEAALLREMAEELGIVPTRLFLGMVQDDRDRTTGRFYRHFVYIVREWDGEVRSREGRRIVWFGFREAARLEALNPLVRFAMAQFTDRGWLEPGAPQSGAPPA